MEAPLIVGVGSRSQCLLRFRELLPHSIVEGRYLKLPLGLLLKIERLLMKRFVASWIVRELAARNHLFSLRKDGLLNDAIERVINLFRDSVEWIYRLFFKMITLIVANDGGVFRTIDLFDESVLGIVAPFNV